MEARIGGPHAPGRLGPGDFRRPKTHYVATAHRAETQSEACCIIGRRAQATVQRGAPAAARGLPAARVGVVLGSVVAAPAADIDRMSWSSTGSPVGRPCVGAAARSASASSSGCARPVAISCARSDRGTARGDQSSANHSRSNARSTARRRSGRSGWPSPFAGEASRKVMGGVASPTVHLREWRMSLRLPSLRNKFGPGACTPQSARSFRGVRVRLTQSAFSRVSSV